MSNKEEKAKEYVDWLHNEVEEFYGEKFERKDMYYRSGEILAAFEAGWDEAFKNILVDASKELPEYDIDVWVINENGEQLFCHRSNENIVQTDKYGWCNYNGSDIIAWIRPVSFDEIIKLNKDVLKRLKYK